MDEQMIIQEITVLRGKVERCEKDIEALEKYVKKVDEKVMQQEKVVAVVASKLDDIIKSIDKISEQYKDLGQQFSNQFKEINSGFSAQLEKQAECQSEQYKKLDEKLEGLIKEKSEEQNYKSRKWYDARVGWVITGVGAIITAAIGIFKGLIK